VPISGRQAGDIGADSQNWPFTVEGEIDDQALISLVELIKSQPPVPDEQHPVARVPIESIAGNNDGVVVTMRTGDDQGQEVWFVRQNRKWVITKSFIWME
jgi:hypothetical protein